MPAYIRITLLYALFGIAWILFSDSIVDMLFSANPELYSAVQSAKGILYVLITSFLLFCLIYNEDRVLKEHEAEFRMLFMNNPQPMWVYDIETLRFLEVNDTAVSVYGYSRQEFLQMTIKDIRPASDLSRLTDNLAQRRRSIEHSHAWRHQMKSGEIIHVDIVSHQIHYQSRDAVFVVAIDISERIQLESERIKNQSLHAELEKEIVARANRDRLASMVSHDLRTPLAVIMSSASMLERYNARFDLEQRVRHYQKILQQSKQLNEELEEILLWLRSEASTSTFQPVMTNILEFIKSILIKFTLPDNPQRVQLISEEQRLLAEIDAHLFQRVVANLVSNACKYSADNTHVDVILTRKAEQLELIVRDEGIGIPESNLEHLFKVFYRAENALNVQGTGLGLSIVKEIVELHQGTISVESIEGEGTSFTVNIPLLQPVPEPH